MSKMQKCIRNLSLFLLTVLMLAGCQTQPQSSQEGRYFTWVDEQGHVRRSPIPESQNPVEARAQKIREQNQAATGTGEKAATSHAEKEASARKRTAASPDAEQTDPGRVQAPVGGETDARHRPVAKQSNNHSLVNQPENKSDQSSPSADSAPAVVQTNQSGSGPYKAPVSSAAKAGDEATDSEYNLKNYPDGNELAARGFVREGDPLPYFTWRDSQGQMRVSHYRPKGKSVGGSHTSKNVPRLTEALVLDGERAPAPKKASPDVLSVMGVNSTNTIFDDWRASCCQTLPVQDARQWERSREFQVDMTLDGGTFTFSTGESAYQLIRLPQGDKANAFVMRLRSYIHHGVFVPTLAFLDSQLRTRRLVTDMAFTFNPETWHSLGSFEAIVPVFPGQGDRWLLVMSTKKDQGSQTVVEKEGWPTTIPHQAEGTLGLTEVE